MTERYVALLGERRRALQDEFAHIFRSSTGFVCEIGCGHGHFLTAFAAAHPDQICVGLDLIDERIARACRKRDRAGLKNLHFLRAEARLFLDTLPVDAHIASLFILFPDPWPKLRHHKHRILQPAFLDALATRATLGCRLHFRTDHLPYYAEARAVVRDHPRWSLVDASWPFEFETVFQQRVSSFASFIAVLQAPPGN